MIGIFILLIIVQVLAELFFPQHYIDHALDVYITIWSEEVTMSLSLHESVSLITSFPSEIETRCHKVMFHTKSPPLHFSIHKFSYFYKVWTVGVPEGRDRQ